MTTDISGNKHRRQQTLIGLATTHHTFPKFSPYLILLIVCKMRVLFCYTKRFHYEEYKIRKLLKTPLIREYNGFQRDLIDKCLQIDCAMSAAASLTSKERSPPCTLIGSWTVFNTKTCKPEAGCLPVSVSLPGFLLDFLLNMKNDQNLSNILCHNDHGVFYKLSQIVLIEENKSIVNIIGGFYILLVTLKVFYRKCNLKGLKERWLK